MKISIKQVRKIIREEIQRSTERWSYEEALERYDELLTKHLKSVRASEFTGPRSELNQYMTSRLKAGYEALDQGMLETGWSTQEITDETQRRTRQRIKGLQP